MQDEELKKLREAVERCEKSLERIKVLLICIGCLLVFLILPPLGAIASSVLFVGVILCVVLGLIYVIMWICERLFGRGYADRLG